MKINSSPASVGLCILIVCIASFSACKKETSQSAQAEATTFANVSAESAISTDALSNDIFNTVMGLNNDVASGGVFNRVGSPDSSRSQCSTIQFLPLDSLNLFPVKTVIDFKNGCTDNNGVTRKGKIITVYSGRLKLPGNTAETTFENFYINNVQVEGIYRLENMSTSELPVFDLSVRNGKTKSFNGNYIMWNSKYTVTQTHGLGTPSWYQDDIFNMRGEANGAVKTDSIYLVWNSKILEPLIKSVNCKWMGSGKVGVGKSSTDAAIIDYGNGICDNIATLIINGATREITLH